MTRRAVIAVIGSGGACDALRALAYAAGQAIGAAGCHLVCGGRGGVMEAACHGHSEGRPDSGPLTLGILPGYDRSEANGWVDVVLPTGLGLARNVCVVAAADAVVAIAGGSGTLSELAFAWQLGRPVAAVASSGGWAGELGGRALDDTRGDRIHRASTAEEAISYLIKALECES